MNNNAIEYGSKQIEKNKLHFEIIKNEKEIYIKIEVEDNGNGKSPKTAEEMNYLRGEK
jgi:sensor histidine kinase YesM